MRPTTRPAKELVPSIPQPPQRSKKPPTFCSLPPETGKCRARFNMFYYDPASDSCQTFTWGGCNDGNANRFKTAEECEATCNAGNINLRPGQAGTEGVLGSGGINRQQQGTPNAIKEVEAQLLLERGPSNARNAPSISIR